MFSARANPVRLAFSYSKSNYRCDPDVQSHQQFVDGGGVDIGPVVSSSPRPVFRARHRCCSGGRISSALWIEQFVDRLTSGSSRSPKCRRPRNRSSAPLLRAFPFGLGGDDAGRDAHRRGARRHRLQHHRIGANARVSPTVKLFQYLAPALTITPRSSVGAAWRHAPARCRRG